MAKPKYAYDEAQLLKDAEGCATRVELAERHGIPAASLQKYCEARPAFRKQIADALASGAVNGRAIESDDPREWGDIAKLLTKRGLKPADWQIIKARVNEWGGPSGTDNAQLRVELEPARNLLAPARSDGWRAPKAPKVDKSKPFMVMASGDRHCPLHDEGLHAASLAWLREFQPEVHVDVGDILDFAELSRHRKNPARPQSAGDCIQAAYNVKRAEVQASPNTQHVLIPGNHDYRLRNSAIDQRPGAYGLKRADNPDLEPEAWPVESLPHLLRLDELGVEFIGGHDEYDQYEYEVAPGLYALHGYKARPRAGATAASMIDSYAASVIVGHVHRQGITTLTKRDGIRGEPREYLGMEVGTMARRNDTLGYDHHGDHQHGFGTAIVWPDGRHLFELARWDGRSLVWRNWRCTP
jgi:hypothetical protein